MKKEMLEALEHISTHTVQLGHMLARMSAQIDANEAQLAQLIMEHEEHMGRRCRRSWTRPRARHEQRANL